MAQLGFYFNQKKCSGCKACQIACKDMHNLEIGVLYRQVRAYETGRYPAPGFFHYSAACNHCGTPACVVSCPNGSLEKLADGTVQIDLELCIGCKQCIDACPYGVPQYRESDMKVGKCDACSELREQGLNPACVDACNMRVLEFGEIEELKAKRSSEELTSDLPFLPDSAQTNPSIIVNPRPCALERNFTYHPGA